MIFITALSNKLKRLRYIKAYFPPVVKDINNKKTININIGNIAHCSIVKLRNIDNSIFLLVDIIGMIPIAEIIVRENNEIIVLHNY